MSTRSFPTAPGQQFEDLLAKSGQIKDERLAAEIPRAYFTPRPWRGALGFALSATLYAGAIVAMAFSRAWLLDGPLLIIAGLGGWGLHCIAHDCGHGSFSRSRKLNSIIGHISLLPLIYPFHAWRHVHNMHHAHSNNLELDTDWRPMPAAAYARMPLRERLVYRWIRTWGFWGGSLVYWMKSAFRPSFFPKRQMRRDVRRSICVVAAFSVLYFPPLIYFTGIRGLLLYFVAPFLVIHVWFSVTTLMHHSASDVPYLTSEYWTRNAGRLLLVTDYRYPRWLLFLTHNISMHTAHHVAPAVPFYNLLKAQEALKQAYPGMVRERKLSLRYLWCVVRRLHFYDVESGYYASFDRLPVTPGEEERAGRDGAHGQLETLRAAP
jgi:omega-6 fatty acid desaturase (delta-12 desaturase)